MRRSFIIYFIVLICYFGNISKIYAQSKQSDAFFAQGIEYFNNNQYDEAINSFLSSWKNSCLWLEYLYKNGKNDNKRDTMHSENILNFPYDRKNTRIADSLLSIALLGGEDVTLEKRYASLIASKNEYSKILGFSNANIVVLSQFEANFYEELGQTNNQINSLHKYWEFCCDNYGYGNGTSFYILDLIKKAYLQSGFNVKDTIPGNRYRSFDIENFHFIERKVGHDKLAYGLVYQSGGDTELVLPAIYHNIELFEKTPYIRLHTRCDEEGYELYRLFDLSRKKFSKESKYFDIVESPKIDSSGNPVFEIWSGLLDFDGSLYKYTENSTVKINKDFISVKFKGRKKTLPFDKVLKINKPSTLFNSSFDNDSIAILKELYPNIYLTFNEKREKYGLVKEENGKLTTMLPSNYDEIKEISNNKISSNPHFLYAIYEERYLIIIDVDNLKVSKPIKLPISLFPDDEIKYYYTICYDSNDIVVKCKDNYISFCHGIVGQLPWTISTESLDNGHINISDGIVQRKYDVNSLVKFLKSYKDKEYITFDFSAFEENPIDIDGPIGDVSLRADYPQGNLESDKIIRELIAYFLYALGEHKTESEYIPTYISNYQCDPRIMLDLGKRRCEIEKKIYADSKFYPTNINNGNRVDYLTLLKLCEDDRLVTYKSYYYNHTGGFHGFELNEIFTYDKSTGKLLKSNDIIDSLHLFEFKKVLAKYIVKCDNEKFPDKENTFEESLFGLWKWYYMGKLDEVDIFEECNPKKYKLDKIYSTFPIGEVGLTLNGVSVTYQPYEINAGGAGYYEIEIPYEEIISCLKVNPIKKDKKYSRLLASGKHKQNNDAFNQYLEICHNVKSAEWRKVEKRVDRLEKDIENNLSLFDIYVYACDILIQHYINQNKLDLAISYTILLLKHQKNILGEDNSIYINSLTKYTRLYMSKNRNDYASTLCSELETIENRIKLKNKKEILSDTYIAHSEIYADMGDYYSALQKMVLSDIALNDTINSDNSEFNNYHNVKNIEPILGESDLQHFSQKCLKSQLYFQNGDIPKAVENAQELNKLSEYILENVRSINDSRFKKLMTWYSSYLPMLAEKSKDDSLSIYAYNALLMMKNIALNSEIGLRRVIESSHDTSIINKYNEIESNNDKITYFTLNLSQKGQGYINELKFRNKVLEEVLIEESKDYGDYQHSLRINIDSVKKYISPNDVAIEFANYEMNNNTFYLALILPYGQKTPFIMPLFSKIDYDTIVNSEKDVDSRLANLIWNPILPYIKESEKIIFAPVGELYSLGIEYLPINGKSINEMFKMYRVSSTREIVLSRKKQATSLNKKNVVLYGGINYNLGVEDMQKEFERYKNIQQKYGYRSAFDSIDVDRANYEDLPQTQAEIDEIYSLLSSDSTRFLAFKLDGDTATESSLKSLSGRNLNILHIATHGFYLPKEKAKKLNYDFLAAYNKNVQIQDIDLLRSGLLFAGANNSLKTNHKTENFDDGVLTSLEIASLDFKNLDMAVLSACKTGQGELTDDGVAGLQRGFKKAGVQTLLMSLWKVNDNATKILMLQFYKNILAGKSKYQSFTEAQEYLKNYKNGLYSDPKYWKAFILLDAL